MILYHSLCYERCRRSCNSRRISITAFRRIEIREMRSYLISSRPFNPGYLPACLPIPEESRTKRRLALPRSDFKVPVQCPILHRISSYKAAQNCGGHSEGRYPILTPFFVQRLCSALRLLSRCVGGEQRDGAGCLSVCRPDRRLWAARG